METITRRRQPGRSGRSARRRTALLGLLAALVPAGAAAAPMDDLQRFFRDVRTFEARFEQVVLDENAAVVQQSAGRVWIRRPGRFRWEYERPYVQQVVGDGERLWVYDRDLKQASVRNLTGALGATPAQWLAGGGELERDFVLQELETRDSLEWVELRPRRRDAGFAHARVGFERGRLGAIELKDGLGQLTRITLRELRENPAIDPARFVFKPPPGVDVLSE
jgi:outer membrane lipoprotein carrier protein